MWIHTSVAYVDSSGRANGKHKGLRREWKSVQRCWSVESERKKLRRQNQRDRQGPDHRTSQYGALFPFNLLTDFYLPCFHKCLCSCCFPFNWNIFFSLLCLQILSILKSSVKVSCSLTLNEFGPYQSYPLWVPVALMAISIVLCVASPCFPALPPTGLLSLKVEGLGVVLLLCPSLNVWYSIG